MFLLRILLSIGVSTLQADIASRQHPGQLVIALEPEAASVYCRKLKLNQLVPERGEERDPGPGPGHGEQQLGDAVLVMDEAGVGRRQRAALGVTNVCCSRS